MLDYDPERARAAVQFLVSCAAFPQYVKGLRSTLKKPRSLPYRDDAEPLNELLKIGRQDPQAFENLIALAEVKVGTRNDYQRTYVAQRRARERKALRLEELLTGRKLSMDEKREALYRFYEGWNSGKAEYLTDREAEFLAEHGQEPTWQVKNTFTSDYWAQVDYELNGLLDEAEQTLNREVKRKRVVVVPRRPPKPTAMSEAFAKLMAQRRK